MVLGSMGTAILLYLHNTTSNSATKQTITSTNTTKRMFTLVPENYPFQICHLKISKADTQWLLYSFE
jgi:hypothetical protein